MAVRQAEAQLLPEVNTSRHVRIISPVLQSSGYFLDFRRKIVTSLELHHDVTLEENLVTVEMETHLS